MMKSLNNKSIFTLIILLVISFVSGIFVNKFLKKDDRTVVALVQGEYTNKSSDDLLKIDKSSRNNQRVGDFYNEGTNMNRFSNSILNDIIKEANNVIDILNSGKEKTFKILSLEISEDKGYFMLPIYMDEVTK